MRQYRRRRLLIGAGALLAMPLLNAQVANPKQARVGILSALQRPDPNVPNYFHRILSALRGFGWIEGHNLTLEARFAEGRLERLTELAQDLMRLRLDVVVGQTSVEARALRQVTALIPVVVHVALDPIAQGLTSSLIRPSNNMTGVIWAEPSFAAKAAELAKEILPGMQRLGLIYTPDIGIEPYVEALETGARTLGITFHRLRVRRSEDVEPALADAKMKKLDFLYVGGGGVTSAFLQSMLDFERTNSVPTGYVDPRGPLLGGFCSYIPSPSEFASRSASLIDKFLRGAKASELPFEYPTRYELTINLKTAKTLSIKVPQSVLLRADRVIE